jgi:hypothetical protein
MVGVTRVIGFTLIGRLMLFGFVTVVSVQENFSVISNAAEAASFVAGVGVIPLGLATLLNGLERT